MKKTEEVFYKHFDDTDEDVNFLELKTKPYLKDEILSAMDEAVEEIAKDFVNWLCDNGYSTSASSSRENGLTFANYSHSGQWQYTTQELYEKFRAAGYSAKNNGA